MTHSLMRWRKRRGFLTHRHTHTLSGIGGSGVARGHSTVKWVKALFLFKATLSASISLLLSFTDQVFIPVCLVIYSIQLL